MGQFLNLSIVDRFIISKAAIKNNKEYYFNLLSRERDLSCYDMIESEEEYLFKAKIEIFNKENLYGFLEEQYELFDTDGKGDIVLEKINSLDKMDDILECCDETFSWCFQGNFESHYFGNDLWAKEHYIIYFIEGKAYMECWQGLTEYMTSLIKKNSKYEIRKLVQLFLE